MVGYHLLILVCVVLIIGYLFEFIRIGFIVRLYPDFYYHVSNLCISIIFYAGIGLAWITSGVKFRYIVLLGGMMIGANVVCETVMSFMNTTDFTDAVYGVIGVVIGFVYLAMIYKNGLTPLEESFL